MSRERIDGKHTKRPEGAAERWTVTGQNGEPCALPGRNKTWVGSLGESTKRGLASILRDRHVSVAHKRVLVSALGRVRGNHYVQRMLAQTAAEDRQDVTSSQPAPGQRRADAVTTDRYVRHTATISRAPYSIQRVAGGTTLDPRAPERTPFTVTGNYEATARGDTLVPHVMQINQAGHHVEGWLQRREELASGQATLNRQRLWGDLESAAGGVLFHVHYNRTGARGRGVAASGPHDLRFERTGSTVTATLQYGRQSIRFRRVSTRARIADEALAAIDPRVREVVGASVAVPLHAREIRDLNTRSREIARSIQAYYGSSRGLRQGRANEVDRHYVALGRAYPPEQRVLILREVRARLGASRYSRGEDSRTYLTWLEQIVAAHPRHTLAIQRFMEIRPGAADHAYRFRYDAFGPSGDIAFVGGQVMIGRFRIEKTAPARWQANYVMGIVGLSGGPSAGAAIGQATAWSDFSTSTNWTQNSFIGPITMGGVTGSASAGVGGGASGSVLTFYGDGSLGSLAVNGSGPLFEVGVHAGVEVGGIGGYIGRARQQVRDELRRPRNVEARAGLGTMGEFHFELDDPSLNDRGYAVLRRFCADHLRAFQNPGGELRVNGYTDPVGTPERNQRLSELRAFNTLRAIEDILGGQLRIHRSNRHAEGFGERPAQSAIAIRRRLRPEQVSEAVDPSWRRVDVLIDGHVVIRLPGAPHRSG